VARYLHQRACPQFNHREDPAYAVPDCAEYWTFVVRRGVLAGRTECANRGARRADRC
jgi:hypothetical protein